MVKLQSQWKKAKPRPITQDSVPEKFNIRPSLANTQEKLLTYLSDFDVSYKNIPVLKKSNFMEPAAYNKLLLKIQKMHWLNNSPHVDFYSFPLQRRSPRMFSQSEAGVLVSALLDGQPPHALKRGRHDNRRRVMVFSEEQIAEHVSKQ